MNDQHSYPLVVLCVLDGWGIADEGPGNAVARANTPRLDSLFMWYPDCRLEASGTAVGLPPGVMGNSEVGHLTMGAGYVEPQSLELIDRAVRSGEIFQNAALRKACGAARDGGGTLHLLGLLSTGGVHADMAHLAALVELARREGVQRVAVHAFLDGRDMPPRSAMDLLGRVGARVATVQGRYYAMDRDKRWERTARAWRAIVDADAPRVASAQDALLRCYADAECRDELMEPYVVGDGAPVRDGDALIFFNFRPDRARQLTRAFMDPGFTEFQRDRVPSRITFVSFTDYQLALPDVLVAFAPHEGYPLARVLADAGLRQLHIAETEKYAHVTYFFNGGREEPFEREDRVLVPSPKVSTYDLAPEMSAAAVAAAFVERVRTDPPHFAIVNFANPDMVGHTGVIEAAMRAMEATDAAVGAIVDAVFELSGAVVITADHGNAEEMLFPDGSMNTQHSTNPVPALFVGPRLHEAIVRDGGLSDIAPTILDLMGLPASERMTGSSLLGLFPRGNGR